MLVGCSYKLTSLLKVKQKWKILVINCFGLPHKYLHLISFTSEKTNKQLAEIAVSNFMTVEYGIETLSVNMAIAQQ